MDRPVTQLAEVDMNNASTNAMGDSTADEGSISRAVPTAINRAKPKIDIRAGDRNRQNEIGDTSESLSITFSI
jgi:hypothetical protein